ncbi:ParB/RepB/Spo0J family partition protein [Microbacterium jejuense]|uniref:ParB/RepB/Spo0J family partition protein n=1 Tax=Microbacterium jejuense TaxID=1263637 RepID=A0ABS7HR66_9MICO|nr:ParB/RepB/Spo0J family partition protein [Microbacterium jejuense]MBW9095158.1 ParB/RepB/Spo0J family partition protein [Microbacterium jejuense]
MTTNAPELTLMQIDPRTLGVRDQARADATPDDELVASVKRHGIMQPPTVMLDADIDGYVILVGHRRVGAAIAAGLDEITVIVRAGDDTDEVLKLEQQIVENERRKALSARELAQGYRKLELFGKTPADIARELGEKPDRVRAGLKITASAAAAKLVDEDPSIDFEQAAIIAEFEDHPNLQQKLIETATTNPANFKRDVETQRTQREVDSRIATLKAQLDAEGIALAEVITYDSEWWRGKDNAGRTLDRLGIRVEEHIECPGHAAIIHKAQAYYLATQPNDWILYVCTDWQGNGHDSTAARPERTPEEIEEDLRIEAERARERQAWREAEQLREANTRARREWLHGYLTTGRLRPTAAHFDLMAAALGAQISWGDWIPAGIAMQILTGSDDHSQYGVEAEDALAALIAEPSVPSLRILVAAAIATFENGITLAGAVKYFDFLREVGYELTDTDREHLATATERAAAANDDNGDADEDGGDE